MPKLFALSNFNPAHRGIEIPVSASGLQFDNTPHFGKKCKLVNEGCRLFLPVADFHILLQNNSRIGNT